MSAVVDVETDERLMGNVGLLREVAKVLIDSGGQAYRWCTLETLRLGIL